MRQIRLPVQEKICEWCNKPFQRYKGVSVLAWEKQRTCSTSCGKKLTIFGSKQAYDNRPIGKKKVECPWCGKWHSNTDRFGCCSKIHLQWWNKTKMTQEQFKSLKRYCARPECGKLLTQNVGEMLSMFSKRETCGRGCSSKIRGMSLRGKPQNRKPVVKKQTEEERLGLVQYKQGTAEFEAIAALYMK